MTLNEYLKENPNSSVETLENLFSVGCVIDTFNGNTFPMMADNTIGFDLDLWYFRPTLPLFKPFLV